MCHETCAEDRAKLLRTRGCRYTSRVLSCLFSVDSDGSDGEPVKCGPTRHHVDESTSLAMFLDEESGDGDAGEEVHESDDRNSSDAGNEQAVRASTDGTIVDIKEQWVYFKVSDSFKCTEVLESLIESIQFMLGEPVTLGFFPYRTQSGSWKHAWSGDKERCKRTETQHRWNWNGLSNVLLVHLCGTSGVYDIWLC